MFGLGDIFGGIGNFIGGFFGSLFEQPKAPKVPKPEPIARSAPSSEPERQAQSAREDTRRRLAQMRGRSQTITSMRPNDTGKTLLGL